MLSDGHAPLVRARHVFRYVPSAPRCKLCHNPFGGVGGRVLRVAGFRPSRKNPNLCSRCCDALPTGGAEVDIAVLFADVRGSTALGERMPAGTFAEMLARFYTAATETLVRHDAVINKLIGDEVMALFVRGISGLDYRRQAIRAGLLGEELLERQPFLAGERMVGGGRAAARLGEQLVQLEPGLVELAVENRDVGLAVSQAAPRVEKSPKWTTKRSVTF